MPRLPPSAEETRLNAAVERAIHHHYWVCRMYRDCGPEPQATACAEIRAAQSELRAYRIATLPRVEILTTEQLSSPGDIDRVRPVLQDLNHELVEIVQADQLTSKIVIATPETPRRVLRILSKGFLVGAKIAGWSPKHPEINS